MTLMAYPGVVISPDTISTDAGEGPFRGTGANGAKPVYPHSGLGTYTLLNFLSTTPAFIFQGGGVSTY